jgi:hypothetical protein
VGDSGKAKSPTRKEPASPYDKKGNEPVNPMYMDFFHVLPVSSVVQDIPLIFKGSVVATDIQGQELFTSIPSSDIKGGKKYSGVSTSSSGRRKQPNASSSSDRSTDSLTLNTMMSFTNRDLNSSKSSLGSGMSLSIPYPHAVINICGRQYCCIRFQPSLNPNNRNFAA